MNFLLKKIFFTSGTKFYSLIIGFFTLSLTAHWLGPQGRGLIASSTTLVSMFATFSDLSLGQVAIHIATNKKGQLWLSPIFGSLLLILIIITFICWSVVFVLFIVSHGKIFNKLTIDIICISFILLPLLIWDQYSSSLFMALDNVEVYNRILISGKTAGFIFLVYSFFFKYGVKSVLFSMIFSQTIIMLLGLKFFLSIIKGKITFSIPIIKALLKGGLKLHLNSIGSFMIMYTDIIIISYYHGLTITGLYQLAIQLISILLIIPISTSMILYGQIVQKGPEMAWQTQRKILVYISLLMIIIALFAKLFSNYFIIFFAGEKFYPSVPIFNLMLFALIGMTFSNIMASQWIGRGLFIYVSVLTICSGIGNFILGLYLIPVYGMKGAVWGTLITYTISVIINGMMAIWCELQYRKVTLSKMSK